MWGVFLLLLFLLLRDWIAQLVAHWTIMPRAILSWGWFPDTARDLSPSQLLWLVYSVRLPCPCVQLHASTSTCMLKIPNTGSYTHKKIMHTLVRMNSAALAAAVAVPMWGSPHFPQGIHEVCFFYVDFLIHYYQLSFILLCLLLPM